MSLLRRNHRPALPSPQERAGARLVEFRREVALAAGQLLYHTPSALAGTWEAELARDGRVIGEVSQGPVRVMFCTLHNDAAPWFSLDTELAIEQIRSGAPWYPFVSEAALVQIVADADYRIEECAVTAGQEVLLPRYPIPSRDALLVAGEMAAQLHEALACLTDRAERAQAAAERASELRERGELIARAERAGLDSYLADEAADRL